MPITPAGHSIAGYGPLPPLPTPVTPPAAALSRVEALVPAAPRGERQEMSDWAKLVIIWALLQSMHAERSPGNDAPLAPPDSAGLTYDAKGKMRFGPTPAGQALTGTNPDTAAAAAAASLTHLGTGSGVAPTTGVDGGMAGAFVNVSA